jgi:hypothetical protein
MGDSMKRSAGPSGFILKPLPATYVGQDPAVDLSKRVPGWPTLAKIMSANTELDENHFSRPLRQ